MAKIIENISTLELALRVFPEPRTKRKKARPDHNFVDLPTSMLVLDFESRVDAAQAMTFGSYRYIMGGECVEEGLIYAQDLSAPEQAILESYARTHSADTVRNGRRTLQFLSLPEFIKKFYRNAYKRRCVVCGYNLPFDLSRMANGFAEARGSYTGGFSLMLADYVDDEGNRRPRGYRPRIVIKHIDNKRALKGFTGRLGPDDEDRIPEGSRTGEPEKKYRFQGHFLDLRQLIFSLTDEGHSLESACQAYKVKHPKQKARRHGVIDHEYIDYNRADVRATTELAKAVLAKYALHPIPLLPNEAYSPASIGKAYLKAMNIPPISKRQVFSKVYQGAAQTAFYGGRAGTKVRKVPVPVVPCDFLSMYSTVNSLMSLWEFITAKNIRVVKNCRSEIEALLETVTLDTLFEPATWLNLTAFVRVIPDGDILPSRAQYASESKDWQVAINALYAGSDDPKDALWYTLPDIIGSILLTGRVPKIVDAFRIVPEGVLEGLKPVALLGSVPIDPAKHDFFRTVIEQRKVLASHPGLTEEERGQYDLGLKILGSATSYGIFAEMNPRDADVDVDVDVMCYGLDEDPYNCRVKHPEDPGKFCFPPLASLITGGAHLMLAMLERSITDLGGTYATEDTDAMTIVATETGGPIPNPLSEGSGESTEIQALSWKQVDEISNRFCALNPYDKSIIPGSILKIEGDNFDRETGAQRQVYCYAIAAKRYALYLMTPEGEPVLLRKGVNNKKNRWSEHGLGHLLNPIDPDSDDREWIAQAWLRMIRKALGLPTQAFDFEQRPAISRLTVSSPAVMRPFTNFNESKPYPEQIKPFNFILSCHIKALGHPIGADPERFHLIAPFELDARKWEQLEWMDQYTGAKYKITTQGQHGSRGVARVKTYGDVLLEYAYHPESKYAGHDGKPCSKQTVGVLQRRHIRVDGICYIGKESNHLEEIEAGTIHALSDAYVEYPDERRDEWTTKVWPIIKIMPLAELMKSDLSRRMIQSTRAGRRPHPKNQALLASIARKWALKQ